jgi:acyl-CoA thioester hydrolase
MNHTSLTLRIDWSEIDLLGHINNVQILKYVQAARVNFWELIGLYDIGEKSDIGVMVASVSCQFKKPLLYPGQVQIKTYVTNIGTTSFRLVHYIYNDEDELCAEAADAEVLFDFSKNEKVALNNHLKNELKRCMKKHA